MDHRLSEFIRLFNEKSFFEAHEILEDLWMETVGEEKDFYKGLIQCAATFVHLQRGNYKGAEKLYRTATGYLIQYPDQYCGIAVDHLLSDFENFFLTVAVSAERRGEILNLQDVDTPQILLAED